MNQMPCVEAIFFAALEKSSPEERAAFLDRACKGDQDLRRQVERLLKCQPKIGNFLEPPVPYPAAAADDSPRIPTTIAPETAPAVSTPMLTPVQQVQSVGAGGLPSPAGYQIQGVLGRGGMGVVYKANQISLKRLVALKMILAGAHASAEDLARFAGEAEAVARLRHPNIVQIYEIGKQDGLPYFSLEFVEGGNLAQKLAGTPLPAREAAQLVETLARAIHAAHQQKIVHRDLKPLNILLAADGQPKITDFGLAKRLDVSVGGTQSGAIMGTPCYMAPEQAEGK
ncbi:MAG: serine/threonine protein kinase, partial [Gemmataceae bacterium]|nr:serine/threonine protein kinase [Gemmataceae bacterium]